MGWGVLIGSAVGSASAAAASGGDVKVAGEYSSAVHLLSPASTSLEPPQALRRVADSAPDCVAGGCGTWRDVATPN